MTLNLDAREQTRKHTQILTNWRKTDCLKVTRQRKDVTTALNQTVKDVEIRN
jgi:hypothetical protein